MKFKNVVTDTSEEKEDFSFIKEKTHTERRKEVIITILKQLIENIEEDKLCHLEALEGFLLNDDMEVS